MMTAVPTIKQLPDDGSFIEFEARFAELDATQLFRAFTNPELLVRWWSQTAVVEPRIGGQYTLTWPDMSWELTGAYEEFEPPARLVFTWQWTHEPDLPMRRVTLDIQPSGGGSILRLRHDTYGLGEAEMADRQSHIDGWQHFLPRLGELVGSKSDGEVESDS